MFGWKYLVLSPQNTWLGVVLTLLQNYDGFTLTNTETPALKRVVEISIRPVWRTNERICGLQKHNSFFCCIVSNLFMHLSLVFCFRHSFHNTFNKKICDMFKFPEVAMLLKATGHQMCFDLQLKIFPNICTVCSCSSLCRVSPDFGEKTEADTRGNNSWLNFEDNL